MSPISREVKYPKPVFFYAASRALERAAYYGMRSILILYVTSEVLAFSYENVGTFYGWFILSFTVSNVIGAIFGDFVFGNKNALVIGSIIMALGMFLLCIPSTIGLYLGLLMIIVGSGFYTPNLMAKYGKQLYGVPHLLDGGFTLLYVMVNVGAFAGTMIITLLGYTNFILGFSLCGIMMILSVLLVFLTKETSKASEKQTFSLALDKRALLVAGTIIFIGVFWSMYNFTGNTLYALQEKIHQFNQAYQTSTWISIGAYITIILGIPAIIICSFFTVSRGLKMAIAFILAAIALGILLLIPSDSGIGNSAVMIMFISLGLMGLAEIILAPIVYATITRNTNSKYLAVILSLSFIPAAFFNFFQSMTISGVEDVKKIILATIVVGVMGIAAFILWLLRKEIFR